jgi:hypothetical protein
MNQKLKYQKPLLISYFRKSSSFHVIVSSYELHKTNTRIVYAEQIKELVWKFYFPMCCFFDIITVKTTKSFVSINMNRYFYCFELASNKKYVQYHVFYQHLSSLGNLDIFLPSAPIYHHLLIYIWTCFSHWNSIFGNKKATKHLELKIQISFPLSKSVLIIRYLHKCSQAYEGKVKWLSTNR